MSRISDTVKHIIIINVIFWIATLLIGKNGDFMNDLFAMHFPLNDGFKPWQIITHMFMHASYEQGGGIAFYHILFNMFGVWMFGTPLEQMWGKKKFIFFYISAGLGSLLLYTGILYFQYNSAMNDIIALGFEKDAVINALNNWDVDYLNKVVAMSGENLFYDLAGPFNGIMLGASGALYGILVAFAMTFPNTPLMLIFLPIPIKAKYFVPGVLAIDLFFGLTSYSMGPIAHFAHIGGALTGFIMAYYWKKNSFNANRWD